MCTLFFVFYIKLHLSQQTSAGTNVCMSLGRLCSCHCSVGGTRSHYISVTSEILWGFFKANVPPLIVSLLTCSRIQTLQSIHNGAVCSWGCVITPWKYIFPPHLTSADFRMWESVTYHLLSWRISFKAFENLMVNLENEQNNQILFITCVQ